MLWQSYRRPRRGGGGGDFIGILVLIALGVFLAVKLSADGKSEKGKQHRRKASSRRAPKSQCAVPRSAPKGVGPIDWGRYQCRAQDKVRPDMWRQCLPRTAYTKKRRAGCPGLERCCPPVRSE